MTNHTRAEWPSAMAKQLGDLQAIDSCAVLLRAVAASNCHSGKPLVRVRREKALDFSGWNSRPGTGSLHPVAIEAAAEATKLSELSMERVARRLRERAGRNVSER